MAGASKHNGDQLKVLAKEVKMLRSAQHDNVVILNEVKDRLRSAQHDMRAQLDRAVALADQEVGAGLRPAPTITPLEPASMGQAGIGGGLPIAGLNPAPAPVPGSIHPDGLHRGAGTGPGSLPQTDMTFGVPGTPIVAGFLTDVGEYNSDLMGRAAVQTYEKMRRGDAQVRATLAACMLPVQSAKWDVVPADVRSQPSVVSRQRTTDPPQAGQRTASTGAGRATESKAKEIADFVKENLFGGLEFRNSTGGWATQSWDEVVRNGLLMLAFGCAVHEDVWRVDGEKIRLRKLASRLPLTFYRWHTEADGETLLALEQYGYRGGQFMNVLLPADKAAVFTYQQEAANFWGIALCRAMYPHWYIKTQLYRIDAIACERNALGIPVFKLPPGFSREDRDAAYNFVTQLAAHEAAGMVEPPGDAHTGLRVVGYDGRLRDTMPTILHHNVMIGRAALALFLDLAQAQHGSRSLGKEQSDFFLLALQNLADQIAWKITGSSIRRLVAFNFGEDAPVPRLVAANVQARQLEDLVDALTRFAQAGLVIPEENLRRFIREELALPEETKK